MRLMSSRSRAVRLSPPRCAVLNCRSRRPLQRALACLRLLEDLLEHEVLVRTAVVRFVSPLHGVRALVGRRGRRACPFCSRRPRSRPLRGRRDTRPARCSAPAPRRRRRRTSRARRVPITTGLPLRAATMRSGWRASSAAMPYVPSIAISAWRTAWSSSPPIASMRCASTSVSVVGTEHVPLRLQLGAQRRGVLDDAVVHHRDVAAAVDVRMRVDVVRLTVRRPARVRDADAAFERRGSVDSTCRTLPAALWHLEPAARDQRHARRVVAAVLQAMQPGEAEIGSASCRPTYPTIPRTSVPPKSKGVTGDR